MGSQAKNPGQRFQGESAPVQFGVDEEPPGKLRVWVQAPALPTMATHHRAPLGEDPTHPFLRPLRRLLVEGNPNLGRILYVLVSGGPRVMPGLALALALTPGSPARAPARLGLAPKRLSIFPGWGLGTFAIAIQGGVERNVKTSIDHITFDERPDGSVKYHLSPLRRPGQPKGRPLKERLLDLEDATGLHLLRLGIREPTKLDSAGTFWGRYDRLPHLPATNCEVLMETSIAARAPFIRLPDGERWERERYLDLNLVLTKVGLKDTDYPLPRWPVSAFRGARARNDRAMTRLTLLTLKGGLQLVLMFASRPGVLRHDFVLHTRTRAV